MSVKLTFGAQPWPWVDATKEEPSAHKIVLGIGWLKDQTPRMRIRCVHRQIDGWISHQSAVQAKMPIRVLLWLKPTDPVDIDRMMKAIRWVEKTSGLIKVGTQEHWIQQLRQAWGEQPWA